jgi:hypothetical protein
MPTPAKHTHPDRQRLLRVLAQHFERERLLARLLLRVHHGLQPYLRFALLHHTAHEGGLALSLRGLPRALREHPRLLRPLGAHLVVVAARVGNSLLLLQPLREGVLPLAVLPLSLGHPLPAA